MQHFGRCYNNSFFTSPPRAPPLEDGWVYEPDAE